MRRPVQTESSLRRLSVCADDFGANDAACEAILELARLGAISATSCLVDAPAVQRHAEPLRQMRPQLSLGLHLDLIEFAPPPLRASLRQWLLRGFVMRNLDSLAVSEQIRRQLLRFEDLFGAAPAFVDGHLHVHQLPGIRECLLRELRLRYGRTVAVRSTRALRPRGFKAIVIQELGGRSLHALLAKSHLHCNSDFAGAYDLQASSSFAVLMQGWVSSIADGGLIMCHPEKPAAAGSADRAREAEFRFLASPEWRTMQAQCHVQLQPFQAA